MRQSGGTVEIGFAAENLVPVDGEIVIDFSGSEDVRSTKRGSNVLMASRFPA